MIGNDEEERKVFISYGRQLYIRHPIDVKVLEEDPEREILSRSTNDDEKGTSEENEMVNESEKNQEQDCYELESDDDEYSGEPEGHRDEQDGTQETRSETHSENSEEHGEQVEDGQNEEQEKNHEHEQRTSMVTTRRQHEIETERRYKETTLRSGTSFVTPANNEQSKRIQTNFVEFDCLFLLPSNETTREVLITEDVYAQAKRDEVSGLFENEVVQAVRREDLPENTQIIGSRFVLTMKALDEPNENGQLTKPKARLVAKGFQEKVENIAIDAPTCSPEAMRLTAFLAAQNKWKLQKVDFKQAFLQSNERDDDEPKIALEPPAEVKGDKNEVWLLKKSV